MFLLYFTSLSLFIWLIILLLPWKPWSTREYLDVPRDNLPKNDLNDITVLIPARNEAKCIETALNNLKTQGNNLKIIIVDDQSTDDTLSILENQNIKNLQIIKGKPTPVGWNGKLWAQEQGLENIKSSLTLLMDADIKLFPNMLLTIYDFMLKNNLDFVSLMADLKMIKFWERLLLPSFIYFFKLLYPFSLSNKPNSKIAAGAGGCILVKTSILKSIGGFESIKNELIDDCSLAKKVKSTGHNTWIGLTHCVKSIRSYNNLSTIWEMVARTAFTQLKYSFWLLILTTLIMLEMFIIPVIGIFSLQLNIFLISFLALFIMCLTYIPTLKFYKISFLWSMTMPFIALLYICMTWTSAIYHFLGKGTNWKQRSYVKNIMQNKK